MKTKNQTEQMLELAVTTAANDDAVPSREPKKEVAVGRKQAWSPFEVWRTRVRVPLPSNPAKASTI